MDVVRSPESLRARAPVINPAMAPGEHALSLPSEPPATRDALFLEALAIKKKGKPSVSQSSSRSLRRSLSRSPSRGPSRGQAFSGSKHLPQMSLRTSLDDPAGSAFFVAFASVAGA